MSLWGSLAAGVRVFFSSCGIRKTGPNESRGRTFYPYLGLVVCTTVSSFVLSTICFAVLPCTLVLSVLYCTVPYCTVLFQNLHNFLTLSAGVVHLLHRPSVYFPNKANVTVVRHSSACLHRSERTLLHNSTCTHGSCLEPRIEELWCWRSGISILPL